MVAGISGNSKVYNLVGYGPALYMDFGVTAHTKMLVL